MNHFIVGDFQMVPGSRKLQIRCGLLMFLAGWLHKCSSAIDDFLSVDDNVLFLTTEMGSLLCDNDY